MVEPFTQTFDLDLLGDELDSLFLTSNFDLEPPKVILDVIRQYAYLLSDELLSAGEDAILLS